MTVDARYVLFLNPDTEVVEGTFGELLGRMDALPDVGLAGCRQRVPERRARPEHASFPSASRLLLRGAGRRAVAVPRLMDGAARARPRPLREEFDLDWTVGAFMLARREALESAGWLDERLFLYCDDPDLARADQAGRLERQAPAADDDPASREEDGVESGVGTRSTRTPTASTSPSTCRPCSAVPRLDVARARVRAARGGVPRAQAFGTGCAASDAWPRSVPRSVAPAARRTSRPRRPPCEARAAWRAAAGAGLEPGAVARKNPCAPES